MRTASVIPDIHLEHYDLLRAMEDKSKFGLCSDRIFMGTQKVEECP